MAEEVPEYESIGPYKVLRVLGSGSFAQVSVGQHVETGEKVALKVINTATWNAKNKTRRTVLLKREIRLCKLLHHPNIIRMIGTMQDGPKVILIMEHMSGGDLENYTYACKHRYIPEKKAVFFFRQIVSGIDYLHKNSITHRDIKPANIILDAKQQVPKLIDFGFTNIFDENEKMQSFLGSPHFAAPELLTGTKYSGPAVDIWSLAVTMYACMTGQLPFQAQTMEKLMDLIVHAEFDFPDHISEPARDLIRRMLTVDADKRATMEDVRLHPFMNDGYTSPPADLAIPRTGAVREIDQTVFNALSAFGYEDQEANLHALQSEDTNTIKNIYCLILEARAREKQQRLVAESGGGGGDSNGAAAATQGQPTPSPEPTPSQPHTQAQPQPDTSAPTAAPTPAAAPPPSAPSPQADVQPQRKESTAAPAPAHTGAAAGPSQPESAGEATHEEASAHGGEGGEKKKKRMPSFKSIGRKLFSKN